MTKWFNKILTFLVYFFLYAPILVLMVFSFNESKARGNWTGFSLRWYQALFQDSDIMKALWTTLLVAVIATIVSTILGTFGAIGIEFMGNKRRRTILAFNQLPVLNPDIITAVSLMALFKMVRIPNGFFTLVLSHIAFCTPYVILSILPKLKQMSSSLPEAAMDLGATPWQTLTKVVIPEIRPGILSGALMAFTLSIDDFVISFFTTGNGVQTLATRVYSMARRGINPVINALSTLMFLTMLILLLIINIRTKRQEEQA